MRTPCGPRRSRRTFVPAETAPSTSETHLAAFAYRTLTVLLAALAVLGQFAYLDALYWNGVGLGHHMVLGGTQPALLSSVITSAVISVTGGILGILVAFRGARDRGALPLGLALSVWGYVLAYSGLMVLFAPAVGSGLRVPFDGHFLVVEALGMAALLRFTALFPTPLSPGALEPPSNLPSAFVPLQTFRGWMLLPQGPWVGGVLALTLIFSVNAMLGRSVPNAALLPLTDLFRLGALTVVVLNLRTAFLAADGGGRDRMVWVVAGFVLLVGAVSLILGGNVLVSVTRWDTPGFNWRPIILDLGVLGLLWGLSMGIFYRGQRNGAVLTRRVALLSFLLMMTLFLAAGLEAFLSGPMTARLSLPRGVGTAIAVVIFTLTWLRTHRALDGFLQDRWAEVAPSYGDPEAGKA